MSVLDRFLRYVTIDTRADESSTSCPSTPGQMVLQELLAGELRAIGLKDVSVDDNGYLMATIPATTADADVPAIGSSRTWTRPRRCPARTSGRSFTAPGTAATSCCPTIRPQSSARPGRTVIPAGGIPPDQIAGTGRIAEDRDDNEVHREQYFVKRKSASAPSWCKEWPQHLSNPRYNMLGLHTRILPVELTTTCLHPSSLL